MNKCACLLIFLVALLDARENPFELVSSPSAVGKTMQIKENRKDFESATITLPSSARILKSVSVSFQNLDGSINEEIVAIEQNVNWHSPLVLNTAKIEEKAHTKEVIISTPEPAKEIPKMSAEKHAIVQSSAPKSSEEKEKTLFKLGDSFAFDVVKNEIKLLTKDTKVRDFLLLSPYKVVVDFQKNSSFATQTVDFKMPPFISATMGNHDQFYRIAILLDGHYRYDISKIQGGYLVKLK